MSRWRASNLRLLNQHGTTLCVQIKFHTPRLDLKTPRKEECFKSEPKTGIGPVTPFFAYTSFFKSAYKRARLYLFARGESLSVVRADLVGHGLNPALRSLTVIRNSSRYCYLNGQNLAIYQERALPLSHFGNIPTIKSLNFLLW